MRHALRVAIPGVAIASTIVGASFSALPVLILGLVTLFYDSVGGILILLGHLVSVWPAPGAGAGSGLPAFQLLPGETAGILLRSVPATILCSVAAVTLIAPGRGRGRRDWTIAALCCVAAALLGGAPVAVGLAPAVVISGMAAMFRI